MDVLRRHRHRPLLLAAAAAVVVLASGCIPPAGTVPVSSPPAPSGCITDVSPTTKRVVTGCGSDVTYNVSVPTRCTTHACGLILDVHGWTMSGDIQEANTQIAAIGRQEGYIVVQPNAPGSPPSWSSVHYAPIAAFVELAVDVWRVDEGRVHVTGFSQGGAMTTWMRCNRTALFASAAPTAMSGGACSNGANMPTLYIQGLNDIFVSQAAIDATIASYVDGYGLDRELVVFEQDGITFTAYSSSTPDTPGFATAIHNHSTPGVNGHCILGSPNPADFYGCDQPTDLSHGRLVVDFFKSNPKRA